ncbi:O-methyltransferase [Phycisphaerales bacterium AB-hyl4]|uniref:O-methyltransferase n=1 Tax=Natronomicrosphaera hydrolytica TaxID=3242702 RepID=A0ABV4U3X0_9BACT
MFVDQVNVVIDRVDTLREQVDDAWQIPRDEAQLLAQLVRMGRCRSTCEIGVSYGFSTLHLAAAVREHGGHLHGFDASANKVQAATKHLTEAGLMEHVTLHLGDARETLGQVTPAQPYDFVFIDAVKTQSRDYLEAVRPKLAERAVIVTDNTSTHRQELGEFVAYLRSLPNATSCAVNVGNGFELTILQQGAT